MFTIPDDGDIESQLLSIYLTLTGILGVTLSCDREAVRYHIELATKDIRFGTITDRGTLYSMHKK